MFVLIDFLESGDAIVGRKESTRYEMSVRVVWRDRIRRRKQRKRQRGERWKKNRIRLSNDLV